MQKNKQKNQKRKSVLSEGITRKILIFIVILCFIPTIFYYSTTIIASCVTENTENDSALVFYYYFKCPNCKHISKIKNECLQKSEKETVKCICGNCFKTYYITISR